MKVAEPIDVNFSTCDSTHEPVRGAAVSSLSISASRIGRFGWHENGRRWASRGRPASRRHLRLASPCWKNRSCGSAHQEMESWVFQHVDMVSHYFPTGPCESSTRRPAAIQMAATPDACVAPCKNATWITGSRFPPKCGLQDSCPTVCFGIGGSAKTMPTGHDMKNLATCAVPECHVNATPATAGA
jgi:hypothetical protein